MDADVIVVGGGPVGLGLGVELGQAGIRTTIIERHSGIMPIPRGQNLTQRTMEHFHFWGAEQALRAACPIPRSFGIGGMTSYGSLLSGYQYDFIQRGLVRPFYYTANERLPQYETERILRERVSELPSVTVIHGWTGTGHEQDGEAVSVALAEARGSGTKRLKARYLVGCDGSRSTIRDAAGIEQRLKNHDKLMVLLVFHSAGLGRLLERFPGKSFFNVLHPDLDGYWQFFGRVDLNDNWFFHAPVPVAARDGGFDFAALLHRAVGKKFDVSFQHVGFWDLRFAVARTYRAGRVFIAGDAAHSHPPYGGYGINTGFEDARNIGWKLRAVLEGWGGPALLDTYDAERRPVFESTSSDFIEKVIDDDRDFLRRVDPARDRAAFEKEWTARSGGARDQVAAFEPHYGASPLVTTSARDDTCALGDHRFEARAGHHLAPAVLSDGRNLFEQLGSGFTLAAFGAQDGEVDAYRAAADTTGVPLTIVSDSLEGERARYGAQLILIRPDQFIAWAGDRAEPASAAVILNRAIGA